MIADGIFEIRQSVIHMNDGRLEHSLELQSLITLTPIREISMLRDAVFDDEVFDAILEPRRPRENAFHTRWI